MAGTEGRGLEPPEEGRKGPPLEPSERLWPCPHLDLRLVASRTVGDHVAAVSGHRGVVSVPGGPGHSPRCQEHSECQEEPALRKTHVLLLTLKISQ